ncbi:hypothetical protein SODALDRAFT_43557 [Sodiomyces alkalinus F11]|uniref:Uncharacterized protein n=1 Tax=Sodiomyces alkalinus (strain CBS 110278 / VKM F-3762 / F11) TaxID=1314773 RepID=A0A3N2QA81_SODAK|nr:hypothetical protein SODALDRAFT_43557 [Sodiomyces alkalinus F11]ROT43627.1 hypothetical protein SODALDRAFT_43557 [Sodiomyces alkalinus F11]
MSADRKQGGSEFERNRSITPNRSLFGSFGEAHRKITKGADAASEPTSTAFGDEVVRSATHRPIATSSPDEQAADYDKPRPASPVTFVPHGSPRRKDFVEKDRMHLDYFPLSTPDPLAVHLHLLDADRIDDETQPFIVNKQPAGSSVSKRAVNLRLPPKLKSHHQHYDNLEKPKTRLMQTGLAYSPQGEETLHAKFINQSSTNGRDRPDLDEPAGLATSRADGLALSKEVETSSLHSDLLSSPPDKCAAETEGNGNLETTRTASPPTGHGAATEQQEEPFDPFAVFDTDSDHSISDAPQDPFEDDRKYSFLRPAAEKEVSRALRNASDLSHPLFAQVIRLEETYSPSPPIPSFDPAKFAERLREEKERQKEIERRESQRKGRTEHFYKSSVIQSAWKTPDNGIRIPTSPPPPSSTTSLARASGNRPCGDLDRKDYTATPFFNNKFGGATAGAPSVTESGNDWVTVSDEQNAPTRTPARALLGKPMGRVVSGSSIANYSDHVFPPLNHQESGYSSQHPNLDERDVAWWESIPYSQSSNPGELGEAARTCHSQWSGTRPPFSQDGFERSAVHGLGISQVRGFFSNSKRDEVFDDDERMELRSLPKRQERNKNKAAEDQSNAQCYGSPLTWTVRDPLSSPLAQDWDDQRVVAESDRLSRKYPSLPFPLLPLKEAARIQAHRRASGLEDQTESGSSVTYHPMTPRLRQPSSTLPSPPTPSLHREAMLYSPPGSTLAPTPQSQQPLPRPCPTYLPSRSNGVEESYCENPFLSLSEQRLIAHTSRFGSGHSSDSTQRGRSSIYRPRLNTRSTVRRYHEDTDPELGAMAARYRLSGPRSFGTISDAARYRQTLFFLLTLLINIPLPVFGITVLFGKLDSGISWWTHGEVHGLAPHQLEWVRIQLVAEGSIYLMMTILLVVVYVQHQS